MPASRRRPLAVVVGSVLAAGVLVGVGRAALGPVVRPAPLGPVPAAVSAAAAGAFLQSWQRSLTTSWSVEEAFVRQGPGGRSLSFPVHLAQRPPDRLQIGLGAVQGFLGGRQVGCASSAAGQLLCRAAPAPPLGARVAAEMATLRPYVLGPGALYAVARIGGCYELRLRLASFPVPPYGRRAVFCFDPASGAPAGSVVIRDAGTDRTTITSAHSPATAADLRLPPGASLPSG